MSDYEKTLRAYGFGDEETALLVFGDQLRSFQNRDHPAYGAYDPPSNSDESNP